MISRDDIRSTYGTIRPFIRRTPVIQADLSELGVPGTDRAVATLKLEQLQCAGSFKARGAFANLLLREVPAAGVVAASGGNHGVAVAYAAHRRGVPAKIFVPTVSAAAKIERIRSLGADGLRTTEVDPKLKLHYVRENERTDVRRVLSNSFGFGGANCSLIFGRPA